METHGLHLHSECNAGFMNTSRMIPLCHLINVKLIVNKPSISDKAEHLPCHLFVVEHVRHAFSLSPKPTVRLKLLKKNALGVNKREMC